MPSVIGVDGLGGRFVVVKVVIYSFTNVVIIAAAMVSRGVYGGLAQQPGWRAILLVDYYNKYTSE